MKLLGRLAIIALALSLASCGRSASYRYKLTLSLDTPDGVKTSFNVVEINYVEINFPNRGEPHSTKGEALYLDLGPGRRPLIALLTYPRQSTFGRDDVRWGASDPTEVLANLCHTGTDFDSWITAVSHFGSCNKPLTIPPDYLPTLITFEDVNNPSSVILVDPNNLNEMLGPGVAWRSMTLQTTNLPLTTGIEHHLNWLSKMPEHVGINGNKLIIGLDTPVTARLQIYDFKRFPVGL